MDPLSRLVVAFDRWQRRRLGIREFSDDPACILRLGLAVARAGAELTDGTVVRPGERIGVLHLWNEHMPRIPPTGPDLAWGKAVYRAAVHSLRLLTQYVAKTPAWEDIHAFRGDFSLIYDPGAVRLLRRLGIEVSEPVPPRGPVAWTLDLVTRLWTWLLRRAFNPESTRDLRLSDLQHRSVWIGRRTLVALYGAEDAGRRRT